jgi:hypothetical protein
MAIILSNMVIAATPKIDGILQAIDDMFDLRTDGTAKFIFTQQKTGEGVKQYEGIYYRRDKDDSFLMVFTAPEVEKGNGVLKQAENMWIYKRNTRTFQHISRDESIAGTDAKAGDFEKKKLTETYKPVTDASGMEKIAEAKLGDIPVYQFEITAKTEDVTYPKQVFWVRRDNFLPLKMQGYSLSGTLMNTSYNLKYTQIAGKYLPIKSMYIDEFEKGNKTLTEISNISIQKIDEYVFTKAYLENLSK